MAMSDCEKCWETPCGCGHDWKKMPLPYLKSMYQMLGKVILEKEEEFSAHLKKCKDTNQ